MSQLTRTAVGMLLGALLALPSTSALASGGPHARTTAPTTARTTARTTAAHAPALGTGVVLFVDGHRIASTRGVVRTYRAGTKVHVGRLPAGRIAVSPVTRYLGARAAADAADGDRDVDSTSLLAVDTVLVEQVDGHPLWRMWLRSGSSTGYRESTDGIHWHPHDADSVIVVRGIVGVSVMRDPASGRYVMIGADRPHRRFVELLSSDGIHWTRATSFRGPLARSQGDLVTGGVVGSRLVTLAKQAATGGRRCAHDLRTGGRTFALSSTSAASGLTGWSATRRTLSADCTDERSVPATRGTRHPMQVYGLPFSRYGDQYLGLPWLFHMTSVPRSAATSGFVDGPVDSEVASSPDPLTTSFTRATATRRPGHRAVRPHLVARGGAGAWDSGMLYAAAILRGTDGLSRVYYTGWNSRHLPVAGRQARIGMATWPLDRFVALRVRRAGATGRVVTTAFHLSGPATRALHLNVSLSTGDALTVGVRDAATHRWVTGFAPTDSDVVTGDSLDTTVGWHGQALGTLSGRDVQLVVDYGRGALYSFQVR